MTRTICLMFLLFSCHFSFCQEPDNKKIQFGIFGGIQLSSTRWSACLIAKAHYKKNIFHLGVKTPAATDDIYGAFPVGITAGYGYKLLENDKWRMAPVADIQWIESKTRNQNWATHYFDFTINYQLTYIKWKKIQINSSFGYGSYYRFFYNNYFHQWEKESGISGLISLGVEYVL